MDLFASRIFHQVPACTLLYSYTIFFNKQGSEEREAKNGFDFNSSTLANLPLIQPERCT